MWSIVRIMLICILIKTQKMSEKRFNFSRERPRTFVNIEELYSCKIKMDEFLKYVRKSVLGEGCFCLPNNENKSALLESLLAFFYR